VTKYRSGLRQIFGWFYLEDWRAAVVLRTNSIRLK
jgi:hypothetical protein